MAHGNSPGATMPAAPNGPAGDEPQAGHARAGASSRSPRSVLRRVVALDELGITLALVGLVALIGAFEPRSLHTDVLLDTLRQASFVAIVAYGMVFLLAMGEFDLSVGGTYAVCLVLAAKWMAGGLDPYLAALCAIGVGMAMGLFNGVLASAFRLPVVIVTIGTLPLYRGLVNVISHGQPVSNLPLQSSFFTKLGANVLGVPASGWAVLVLGVVLTFVFTKTRFGAMVRASGSNRQAARFSGIPTDRVRVLCLVLVGGLAALAGVLGLAFFQGADPTVGSGFELQVIAAAIIGGTAIHGGSGTVPGALIGALIVATINTGLVFFSVDPIWGSFVTGAVILVAVGSDALLRRRRLQRALRGAPRMS